MAMQSVSDDPNAVAIAAPPVPGTSAAPKPSAAPDPASYDPVHYTAPTPDPNLPAPTAAVKAPATPDPANRDLTFGGGAKGAIGTIATLANSFLTGAIKGSQQFQQKQIAMAGKKIDGVQSSKDLIDAKMYDLAQHPDIKPILRKQLSDPKYTLTPEEMKTVQPFIEARNSSNSLNDVLGKMQSAYYQSQYGDKGKGKGKKGDKSGDGDAVDLSALMNPNASIEDKTKAAIAFRTKAGNIADYRVTALLSQPDPEISGQQRLDHMKSEYGRLVSGPQTPESKAASEAILPQLNALKAALEPTPKPPTTHSTDSNKDLRAYAVAHDDENPDDPSWQTRAAFHKERAAENRADEKYLQKFVAYAPGKFVAVDIDPRTNQEIPGSRNYSIKVPETVAGAGKSTVGSVWAPEQQPDGTTRLVQKPTTSVSRPVSAGEVAAPNAPSVAAPRPPAASSTTPKAPAVPSTAEAAERSAAPKVSTSPTSPTTPKAPKVKAAAATPSPSAAPSGHTAGIHMGPIVGGKPDKSYTEAEASSTTANRRLKTMRDNYISALRGDQQAQLSLLTNHLGMTSGAQKGARITKAMWEESMSSAPTLESAAAKFFHTEANGDRVFDGPKGGVNLTKDQMTSMVKLAVEKAKIEGDNFSAEKQKLADKMSKIGTMPSPTPPRAPSTPASLEDRLSKALE